MAVKWQNCVDIDFGVQFSRLSMRSVHGFVRSLKVEPQDVLGLVAVREKRNQGKEVNVVIRDSNIEERFVRIAGIPQNLDLGVVQTRLKEYGTVIDTRWERYRATEDDEVLYPVLATWMIAFADNFRSICLQHLSISDHQSIQSSFTCNLNIPHLAKSTVGLWKMNVLILLEEGFQRTVIDFIEQCSSHPLGLSNVANWWESVLKPGIRRIAIAYCKQRAKRIRETKLFYQSCMQEMSQADTFDWVAFQELRNYSKSWEESTLKGFGVGSRCFDGEENEDATIFHVSRARENFRRCRIEKIIAPMASA
ncbi:hypothetical protein GHT06_001749 [Daphnia sinensis]|uniref:Uncharacterized protein n=1 Tax=Daphnia sinensis TaxID=1820382 RepID=A0AAD5PKP1_9CRUS|nr:hypothetical protein GHT06_001749 [Daphnia sinensis]